MIMRYKVDFKKERLKKNLTQTQLGQMIGVSEKSISKWETGTGVPSYKNMECLCDIFGLSIDKVDTMPPKLRVLQRRLNIFTVALGTIVNIFLLITYIALIIRTNGVMTDWKFERDVYYFLKQEMYYISAIVVSVLTITTLVFNVTKKKPDKKLKTLTLIFLILNFALTILKPNYYRDTYRFVMFINLALISLYICNLVLINKKEKVKVCYRHTNSGKR